MGQEVAMTPEERARYRALLVEHRNTLRGQGDLKLDPLRDDAVSKIDQDAQPLNEMNQVITSSRNRVRTGSLKGVEAALKRLDRDPEDYGRCVECDEYIKAGRLALMPWARLCVSCQQDAEDLAAGRAGRRKHLTDYG
jgi:DnaK suppressor protein